MPYVNSERNFGCMKKILIDKPLSVLSTLIYPNRYERFEHIKRKPIADITRYILESRFDQYLMWDGIRDRNQFPICVPSLVQDFINWYERLHCCCTILISKLNIIKRMLRNWYTECLMFEEDLVYEKKTHFFWVLQSFN